MEREDWGGSYSWVEVDWEEMDTGKRGGYTKMRRGTQEGWDNRIVHKEGGVYPLSLSLSCPTRRYPTRDSNE